MLSLDKVKKLFIGIIVIYIIRSCCYLIQLITFLFYVLYFIFLFTGDYPEDFLKNVGWNVERNPDNLPENLVPGSDDDVDIEDDFDQLSIVSYKKQENTKEEDIEYHKDHGKQ